MHKIGTDVKITSINWLIKSIVDSDTIRRYDEVIGKAGIITDYIDCDYVVKIGDLCFLLKENELETI